MKKIILVFLLSVFSVSAFAGAWTSTYLTVSNITTAAEYDQILLYTEGGVVEVSGCAANKWIVAPGTDARLNRVYSTLLAAASTGRKIKLWYKDVCGSWGYHQFSHVQFFEPDQ